MGILSFGKKSLPFAAAFALLTTSTRDPNLADPLFKEASLPQQPVNPEVALIEQVRNSGKANFTKEAERKFKNTCRLVRTALDDNGPIPLSKENFNVFLAMARLLPMTDIRGQLPNKEHLRILGLSDGEYNNLLLKQGFIVGYDTYVDDKDQYLISSFSLQRVELSKPLQTSFEIVKQRLSFACAKNGLSFANSLHETKIYNIAATLIDSGGKGESVAGKVLDIPKNGVVIINQSVLRQVAEALPQIDKQELLIATAANELMHLRNRSILLNHRDADYQEIELAGKKMSVNWHQINEAFSDLGSLLASRSSGVLALSMTQALIGRDLQYNFSDQISREVVKEKLGDLGWLLCEQAPMVDKTSVDSFQRFYSSCKKAIESHPNFYEEWCSAYLKSLSRFEVKH